MVIHKQIEEAVDFVLRNTRLGAEIHGLLRRESYELPVAAIREMIINAHCHRNLMAESCVQVSIYDDRLEVTSPGGLYNGLTYEQLMNGHSRIRNRVIANVLNQMGLVESWGTGIARIQDAAAAKSLPEPEFLVYDDMFRVNLFRLPAEHRTSVQADRETDRETVREAVGTDRETNTEVAVTDRETSTEPNPTDTDIGIKISGREIILAEIQKNPQTTMAVLAEKTGLSYSGVRYIIRQLQKENRISRIGSTKKGQWIIVNGNS